MNKTSQFNAISLASKMKAVRRYGFLIALDKTRHKQEIDYLMKGAPLPEGQNLYRFMTYQVFEEKLGFTDMTLQAKTKELAYEQVYNAIFRRCYH